jgi:hypothetical protein
LSLIKEEPNGERLEPIMMKRKPKPQEPEKVTLLGKRESKQGSENLEKEVK